MSFYNYSKKPFQTVPPEKGSFPLDHEGLCKTFMIKYMRCMFDNKNLMSACRDVSRDYLECRMENNLMTREKWSKLGFDDGANDDEQNVAAAEQQQQPT